jgi:hypothetical protein
MLGKWAEGNGGNDGKERATAAGGGVPVMKWRESQNKKIWVFSVLLLTPCLPEGGA